MISLMDNRVFCGRYANGCMIKHCAELPCKIVMGFRDLSVWDYEQVFGERSATFSLPVERTPTSIRS